MEHILKQKQKLALTPESVEEAVSPAAAVFNENPSVLLPDCKSQLIFLLALPCSKDWLLFNPFDALLAGDGLGGLGGREGLFCNDSFELFAAPLNAGLVCAGEEDPSCTCTEKCPHRTQPWPLIDREKKARDVDVLALTSRTEETTLRVHCRQRRASCRRYALTSRPETTLSSLSSTRPRQRRSTYICGGIRRYIFAVVSRPSTSSYNSRSTAWTVRTYMERLSLLMWRIRRRRYRTSCTPGACQSSLHFLQSSSLCLFRQNSEK